jgi:hypothetical protein
MLGSLLGKSIHQPFEKFHPHLVLPNYQTFSSFVGAPPEAALGAAQPSSVVYPPGQVQEPPLTPQAISEILEQWNQMKCVVSDMNVGMSDLKIASNETRLELPDHRGQLMTLWRKLAIERSTRKIKDSACRAPSSLLWS